MYKGNDKSGLIASLLYATILDDMNDRYATSSVGYQKASLSKKQSKGRSKSKNAKQARKRNRR